jgi:hypothetical protein
MLWLRLGAERRLWRKRKRFLDRVAGKALLLDSVGSIGWERRWDGAFEDYRAWSLGLI